MLKRARRSSRRLTAYAGPRVVIRAPAPGRAAPAGVTVRVGRRPHSRPRPMDRYVIERSLPGAGALSDEDVREISAKLNDVLSGLGDDVAWVHSYVTDDKFYCVYDARDPELIRRHALAGGFPCDSVEPVRRTISPDDGR